MTEATKRTKRSREEMFVIKAQEAVAKLTADYRALRELADKYQGKFNADQVEKLFSHIEEKLQVPTEAAFKAALEGKAAVQESEFSLAPVATSAT